MEAVMARFDLTDFEWGLIQPHLPNKPRGVAWRGWTTGGCSTASSGCCEPGQEELNYR
jgi:transposase